MAGRMITGYSVESGADLPPFDILAGSTVVLCVRWNSTVTLNTVVDSAGNSYTRRAQSNTLATLRGEIWVCENATAGTGVTFTLTFSSFPSARYLTLLQFADVPAASFDTAPTAGTNASGTTATTGAFTTSQADAVVIYYFTGNTTSVNWTHNGTDVVRAAHDRSRVQGCYVEYPTAVLSGATRQITCSGTTALIHLAVALKANAAGGGGGGGDEYAHASFGMAA